MLKRVFPLVTAVIVFGSCGGEADAALVINITEGTGGTSVMQLTATGVITTNDGTGNLMNVGTPGDTFLRPGTSVDNVLQDIAVSPTINLGSATTNRIFVFDANDSGGLNSRIGFGTFSGMFMDGDNAADLNGVYPTTIPFSFFEPGTYSLIPGFTNQNISLTDIGPITLNIGSIPEPSSLLLLSSISFVFMLRRSR